MDQSLPLISMNDNVSLSINDLYYDIIHIILHLICDSYTYSSARLTCKIWNQILKDVLRFDSKKKLFEKIVFTPQLITSYYPNNKIKRKMIIKMYGNFVFYEYDKNGRQIILMKNKSPYYLEYNETNYFNITKRKWDLRTSEFIENIKIDIPSCCIS